MYIVRESPQPPSFLPIPDLVRGLGGAPEPFSILEATRPIHVRGISTDTRTIRPGDLYVAIPGKTFDGHDYVGEAFAKGASGAVVNSQCRIPNVERTKSEPGSAEFDIRNSTFGIPPGRFLVRVEDTVASLGRLAAFCRRRFAGKVVGITGSSGKTTTKEMVAQLLDGEGEVVKARGSFNNHIGLPMTILEADLRTRLLVLEIGTSGPGEIERLGLIARPDIGIVTTVGPCHLEGLGSVEGIAREKASLLRCLAPGGLAILNADNDWTRAMAMAAPYRVVTFSAGRTDADYRAENVALEPFGSRFAVRGVDFHLPVPGAWNIGNALAAVAVGEAIGVPLPVAAARLEAYVPPPMRMQKMIRGGITFLNDAYNANPMSVAAALEAFAGMACGDRSGRKVIVLGDMLELGGESDRYHREIGEKMAASPPDVLVTVGKQAALAGTVAGLPDWRRFGQTREVAREAGALFLPGDLVLLKGSRGMGLERILEAIKPT